ncbi:MAG TPA: deoxyribonuclease V [Candidatus Paceibacterota bacterium]|nr:deoxyribonuclease V [Candidatus Paceibacterota bacterium]
MRHEWNISPKEAIALQKELSDQVSLVPCLKPIETIGGADVSMNRFAKEGFAGFVTLTYPELTLIDHAVTKAAIPFPYIPGLLSFREIPMLLRAWEKLATKPDVLVVDGIGIAHPRRFGIASHLGVLLDIPTIGCAKNVLVGTYEEPPEEPGSYSNLIHKGEVVGAALRTKVRVKPVFVSPGHLITIPEAVALAASCVRRHRLPEPTRLAHNTVNEFRIASSLPHTSPATVSLDAIK